MRQTIWFILAIILGAVFVGCEWETTGGGDSWDDSYSWVNFSGIYRSSSGGYLVSEYTAAATTTNGTSDSEIIVTNEVGGTAPMLQTVLTGSFDNHPGIVPGSITMIFSGVDSAGTFKDNGGGGLSGTYNVVGVADPISATGTIDYDTGVWTLDLVAPGFLEDMTITLNYKYTPEDTAATSAGAESGATGAAIYSLSVEQTGNVLVFTDSNGAKYSGSISTVSTTGGDVEGESLGDVQPGSEVAAVAVIAQFQVTGTSAGGVGVTITGSFSGSYSAGDATTSSSLGNRTMEAIWIEATGQTADIQGKAGSIVVTVTATTTTTTTTGT